MKFTSVLQLLKSSNAVLCVLALALLAQMPHAADVFRLIVSSEQTIWSTVHSYSYAVALELAVLIFVVHGKQRESYGFAVASVLINLCYYGLHNVNLFSASAFPAYLVSVVLPVAIALYSHSVADSDTVRTPDVQVSPKRVTRTVRNTQTVEQSEQFTVSPEQSTEQFVVAPEQSEITVVQTEEQKREQFAIVLRSGQDVNMSKLAIDLGVGRTKLYAWKKQIEM